MFGRANIKKIVREGELDRLRNVLEKDPDILKKGFRWSTGGSSYTGGIFHMTATCNQPALMEFFVTEKGMDVNKVDTAREKWSPLHFAAYAGSSEAAETLLKLGADTSLKNCDGDTPYDLSGGSLKEILRSSHEEKLKQKFIAAAEESKQASEAMIAGTWTAISSDEIMFERELPGHRYRLTDVFNFAAERWTSITKDLKDGQLTQETKIFSDMKDKKIINQAHAQLDKLQGGVSSETAPPTEVISPDVAQKPKPKQKSSYDKIVNAMKPGSTYKP